MAISYDPDDTLPGNPSKQPGLNFTRQGNDGAENSKVRSNEMHWENTNQSEPLRRRTIRMETSSRAELIESIKRGESPTWVPNLALEELVARHNNPLENESRFQRPPQVQTTPPNLLEQDAGPFQKEEEIGLSREVEPMEMDRPRSALHTGDFFDESHASSRSRSRSPSPTAAPPASPPRDIRRPSPSSPWHAPSVPSFARHTSESIDSSWPRPVNTRSRAPSLGSSLSSSFVFRPPTSPLVHASTNTDLDFPASADTIHRSPSPERSNRRRTLPPDSFCSFQAESGVGAGATNFSRPFPPPRRESTLPYQAHQPRRSWASSSMQAPSSPQTPTQARSRRPSFSSEQSPIQHACMVGSFEESILRGRMSTAPSKPLDFVAQIGVLGRGDCKASLRCPAHVSVPFPAVFYNYPSVGKRSFSDDSPSPYVGTIDLEHSLKPIEAKKFRRRPMSPEPTIDALVKDITAPENTQIGLAIDRKKRERQRKRSTSPKGPVGGCYRVPQQGQLQIVIKNPNKTAVKLFLVPYSLDNMEPGTKTFVRQRSFSAGPILEEALTGRPQAILGDPLRHKSILRYLIHLKFCCPSKGRYYLYGNIRVVFANRVPDGKESLRNEVQLPEPRYSCYRPGREASMGSAGAKLAAEKASRRRSLGVGPTGAGFEAMDGLTFTGPAPAVSSEEITRLSPAAIPFHLLPPLQTSAWTISPS